MGCLAGAITAKKEGRSNEKPTDDNKTNETKTSDDKKKRPSTIPLAVKKKTGEASGSKKKQKDELDDPFTVEVIKCFAMNSEKKEATELFRSKELQRHHQAMEALAVREQEFRERQGEFDFKVKRLAQFHELKD